MQMRWNVPVSGPRAGEEGARAGEGVPALVRWSWARLGGEASAGERAWHSYR